MKLRYLAYTGLVAATAVALAIGSAVPSDAKGKKKMAAAAPLPPTCWLTAPQQVCGDMKGMKVSYFNACYAQKDGAKVVSEGACKPAKMAKKMGKKKKM